MLQQKGYWSRCDWINSNIHEILCCSISNWRLSDGNWKLSKEIQLDSSNVTLHRYQKIKSWTCFKRTGLGLCLVYKTDKKHKRLSRAVEVAKFSSGTLMMILKKLKRIKKKVERLHIEMTSHNHQMLTRWKDCILRWHQSWPDRKPINRRPQWSTLKGRFLDLEKCKSLVLGLLFIFCYSIG